MPGLNVHRFCRITDHRTGLCRKIPNQQRISGQFPHRQQVNPTVNQFFSCSTHYYSPYPPSACHHPLTASTLHHYCSTHLKYDDPCGIQLVQSPPWPQHKVGGSFQLPDSGAGCSRHKMVSAECGLHQPFVRRGSHAILLSRMPALLQMLNEKLTVGCAGR